MTRRQRTVALAWVPFLITLLSLAVAVVLVGRGCPPGDSVNFLLAFTAGISFSLLSLLILYRQSQNRIGWLAAVAGIGFPTVTWTTVYAACDLPGAPTVSWFSYVTPWFVIGSLFLGLPLLFPNGRYLSPGWRRFAGAAFGLLAILGFLIATLPGATQYNGMGTIYPYDNPLAIPLLPETAGPFLNTAILFAIVVLPLGAILSLVQRWRRSAGEVRLQLKWFAFFLATASSIYLLLELYGSLVNPAIYSALNGWLYRLILLFVFGGFPFTVGIAVLKYRLYDIDVIIRRTLIYGLLTGFLALVYFITVVLLQVMFQSISGQQPPLIIVVSTLLIAALFAPLRRRIQELIDRRFFRRKYDAQQVLDRFASAARDETDLEQLEILLLDAVDSTMQPQCLSLWLKASGAPGPIALVSGTSMPAREGSR